MKIPSREKMALMMFTTMLPFTAQVLWLFSAHTEMDPDITNIIPPQNRYPESPSTETWSYSRGVIP